MNVIIDNVETVLDDCYMGYNDGKGKIVYRKISDYLKEEKGVSLLIALPRVEYLYFIDALEIQYAEEFDYIDKVEVKAQKFALGKQTNEIKLYYKPQQENILENIPIVYDEATQSLIAECPTMEPVTLFEKTKLPSADVLPLISAEPLANWRKQLVKKTEELTVTPEKTLNDALQKAKENPKLLVVLSIPNLSDVFQV